MRPAGPRGLRLLSTFDLGEPPASGRIGDCCGEDCPFQPVRVVAPGLVSVALMPVARHANLDCRQANCPPPWLSPGTRALRSSDFPRTAVSHHPRPSFRPCHSLVNVRAEPEGQAGSRCRRGDLNSHGSPHYALNVARLPIPPLRPDAIRLFDAWSRPGDSNPRPAVYETAALPTELGRHKCTTRHFIRDCLLEQSCPAIRRWSAERPSRGHSDRLW